jgi:hypothetical protein
LSSPKIPCSCRTSACRHPHTFIKTFPHRRCSQQRTFTSQ